MPKIPALRICYCNDALSAAEHADALVWSPNGRNLRT